MQGEINRLEDKSMHTFVLALSALAMALSATAEAQSIGPSDVDLLPASEPTLVSAYGLDPLQIGELRLPPGSGPFPVAVVIHGGCWTKGFATKRNTAPIASALAAKGIATWNIEYRQVGDAGGGWPGTFQDWGAATDHLRLLAEIRPLDLSNVMVVGHSAGAHAALFVASRPRLPIASEVRGREPLPVNTAVAIDGPADLRSFVGFDEEICGKPVIELLMGGKIGAMATQYAEASPAAQLPLGVRQLLVSSSPVLSPETAEVYRKVATAAGDKVDVRVFAESGHFEGIAPGSDEWSEIEAMILRFAGVSSR